ncbi:MAG TPA: 4Fe-4S binding protein, partial [Planctomycetaceae bacterium]|nr:4Fe-4S binding protein [Planctomycetaceae bacterium]
MNSVWRRTGVLMLAIAAVGPATACAQFAPPVAPQPEDIGGGYKVPEVQRPQPRPDWQHTLDVGVLVALMVLIAWIVLWRRSRNLTVAATIFGVVYFGFYREGCVCPIGTIQNVTVALVDPNYAVPYVVIAFFFLPLAMALLFGRVFCGGACPLGAIQDLVLVRPVHFPRWLNRLLGSFKYVYLGVAVWFAMQWPALSQLRFEPGVAERRVTLAVVGDRTPEPDETFALRLFGANGAAIEDGVGQATIENDDGPLPVAEAEDEEESGDEFEADTEETNLFAPFPEGSGEEDEETESGPPAADLPKLNVSDVRVTEGNWGLTHVTFRVTLSEPSPRPISVNFEIVDGTTVRGKDYLLRDFIICRFDPFIGLFRMTGPGSMVITGGVFLLMGTFVGRPYCRFLCPYAVLLSVLSRFAWRGV